MKQFIYKTLIAVVAIVLVYELTIAKQIKEFTSQREVLMTKEGRKDGVNKIREELKKAVQKECAKIIANLVAPTGAESLPKPSIQPCKKNCTKKTVQKKMCLAYLSSFPGHDPVVNTHRTLSGRITVYRDEVMLSKVLFSWSKLS